MALQRATIHKQCTYVLKFHGVWGLFGGKKYLKKFLWGNNSEKEFVKTPKKVEILDTEELEAE